jgi:DNA modification methylase
VKFYKDETITLLHGDALEQARALPDDSIDCIVTSPPYYRLRDYGSEGQYGSEQSISEYIDTMRGVFRELRRVLSKTGTLWLNLGDNYANKQLSGTPWRTAIALQADGWKLKNDVVWNKTNAMPSSVTNRLTNRHEHVFLLTKSDTYYFDLDSIREPYSPSHIERSQYKQAASGPSRAGGSNTADRAAGLPLNPKGKNPGDVWNIGTKGFKGAHFAVFPPALAERCISAGCKPGGTVLDPFSGTGTTGMVAREMGRKYIGIDISADYLKLSLDTRLQTEPTTRPR